MSRLSRARGLVEEARSADVSVSLLGGAAIAVLCESARTGQYARELGDIDLATGSRDRGRVERFAAAHGLRADVSFNAANSDVRLRYLDKDDSHVDVFLGELRLCHVVRWGKDPGGGMTLPLPELLLTKTQVVELADKDISDLSALLTDQWQPIWESRDRLSALVRNDWGLWRTSRGTFETLTEAADPQVAHRASDLLDHWRAIAFGPAARMRAVVGDRVRWYDEPEEI